MNYKTRIFNRINTATNIQNIEGTLPYKIIATPSRLQIDDFLIITRIIYPIDLNREDFYCVSFKNVSVPIDSLNAKDCFIHAELKMKELQEMKDLDILKDL